VNIFSIISSFLNFFASGLAVSTALSFGLEIKE